MKFIFILFFFVSISSCFADTYVAVLETISENQTIGLSEKLFITDKLREKAQQILPVDMGFTIMTRENIEELLPSGVTLEDCEGRNLVETGRNIKADYVVQARVSKINDRVTLTAELYETKKGKLLNSFTLIKPDVKRILIELEKKSGTIFESIPGAVVLKSEYSIAVLDVSVAQDIMGLAEQNQINKIMRSASNKNLDAKSFAVFAGQKLLKLMPPGKKTKDMEGKSAVEIGKILGLDFVTQLQVVKVGTTDRYFLSASIWAVSSNKPVYNIAVPAGRLDDVLSIFEIEADKLFEGFKRNVKGRYKDIFLQ